MEHNTRASGICKPVIDMEEVIRFGATVASTKDIGKTIKPMEEED